MRKLIRIATMRQAVGSSLPCASAMRPEIRIAQLWTVASALRVLAGLLVAVFLLPAVIVPSAYAQNPGFDVLHSFSAYHPDGFTPIAASIRGSDGNFYGTTQGALSELPGACGTVYQITPGGNLTILHTFANLENFSTNTDGAYPQAGVVQGTDGSFYGAALEGGTAGNGTIYKVSPTGDFTVLHTFSAVDDNQVNGDGSLPQGGLVQGKDGNFYGTAQNGGAHAVGTVYKVTPGGVFTTLHSFGAGEGATPMAGLVQAADGNFYGTTYNGGTNGDGTVYKITPGGVLTTIFSFDFTPSGSSPAAPLIIGKDGNFYGTTYYGGPNDYGSVFKITPAGVLTTFFSFSNTDGNNLFGGLAQGADGNFYGTTFQGADYGNGTVFKVTPAGVRTTLHVFSSNNNENLTNVDGAYPESGLAIGTDGNFYGTTSLAGTATGGTFYRITPAGVFTTLHNFAFAFNAEGVHPNAPLLELADGTYYGTAAAGGSTDNGTIFKIGSDGNVTAAHSFGGGADGSYPYGGLTTGNDGGIYGTTIEGANGSGTIFRLTAGGDYSVLHSFEAVDANDHNSEGAESYTGLTLGTDGNFYGTTAYGGANGNGTIYKLTPAGGYTILHTFSAPDDNGHNTEGAGAALTLGHDGNFYGAAAEGGANGNGTIFKMSATGAITVLYTFAALDENHHNAAGGAPGPLTQGTDGAFYGMTTIGGANSTGTVFKVTTAGTLTTLYTFSALDDSGDNTEGVGSVRKFVQARDGNFYCTTDDGGGEGQGTVFKITPAGTLTPLFYFGATGKEYDNRSPSSLAVGIDGNLYGSLRTGGDHDNGEIFAVTFNPVISSALTATATAGKAFTYQITASGKPTKYGASGLPTGLTINQTTGVISGTPKTAGTATVTIAAFNSAGAGTAKLALTIKVGAPVITSTTTAIATTGVAFSYQIAATNSPTSYGASGLPSGLTINQTSGLISGTPKTAGTSTVTIAAFNGSGSGTARLTLTVKAGAPVITSATTASATTGTAFSYQIAATNSPTSYGASGLPSGLAISQTTGKISGTPTKAGTFTVTVAAFNAAGSGTAKVTLTVKLGTPVITSSLSATGRQGAAFSYQIAATNAPTKYGASGLPTGLTIDQASGKISGSPAKAGTFTVTVAAFNATGSGTAKLTLTINPPA